MTKRKRRNRRAAVAAKWFGGLGCLTLLAALAVGGFFLYQRIKQGLGGGGIVEPPVATEDVAVQRGDVTEAIGLWGQVQPIRTQTLSFHSAGGKILSVDAMVGMPVTAGQVLVSLDVAALERGLAEAQAALQTAQADLAELTKQDPMRQYELELAVSNARASLTEARQSLADYDAGRGASQEQRAAAVAALAQAQAALNELVNGEAYAERLAQLQYVYNISEVEHGVYTLIQNPSEEDRDREWLLRIDMLDKDQALREAKLAHQTAVRAAQRKVAEAQQALDALDREISLGRAEVERGKLEVAVQLAEVEALKAETALAALEQEVDPVKLAKARAKVLKLEGQVADAKAALADAQLVAPFDGTVVDVKAFPQSMASTGADMVTLADTSAYVLVANLNEIDVARVKEGQEATLSFDAFGPENKVTGRVGAIPSYGRYNNGIAEYPIRIALDGLELPVMEGMGASISIPLGVRHDVLIIPAAAIDYYPDGSYVNIVKGEQVERRRVELGVGDGITVEVVEGLELGEVVRVRLVGNQLYGAVVRGG